VRSGHCPPHIYISKELQNKLINYRESKAIRELLSQISELEIWQYNVRSADFLIIKKSLVSIWYLDKSVQIVDSPRERLRQRHCSSLLVFWGEEYYIESFIKLPQPIPNK
jgi:hypothetical protein